MNRNLINISISTDDTSDETVRNKQVKAKGAVAKNFHFLFKHNHFGNRIEPLDHFIQS
jgi:hypothetical protein